MALDKWIAAIFLVISIAYGYTSFTYELLPFERYTVFLPNTLPNALAIIAGLLCLMIILTPTQPTDDTDPSSDGRGVMERLKEFEVAPTVFLVIAMIGYALALRPIGFLTSTTIFLVATGWILGERKLHIMIPIAVVAAGSIWYLVQQALGLYLRPLPWFLM